MSIEAPTPVQDTDAILSSTSSVLDLIAPQRELESQPVQQAKKVIAHGLPTRLRDRFPHGINKWNFSWMLGMHIGAIAAFWHFSWVGLATCAVLHFVTACLGVTLGYHRLLTHGSLIVPTPVKYFFSLCGMFSAEGSPLFWVATHRKHHVLSDQDGDPHSHLPGHGAERG